MMPDPNDKRLCFPYGDSLYTIPTDERNHEDHEEVGADEHA